MPIQDLIAQLDTEISEHSAAADALTVAREALAGAQTRLDTATTAEGKEKADVVALWTQIRDQAQAEIDRLA